MKDIKKFDEYELNEGVSDDITAEDFLFNRYSKYFSDAKSFKGIERLVLPFSRIAALMEEYHQLKTK